MAVKVRVQSILIASDAFTISVRQSQQLAATVLPHNATDKTVTWNSADQSKATVSNIGEVTAVGPGQVEITATANDGSGIVGKATVTVTPLVTAITINPADPVVGLEKTLTLTISVTPTNANKAVTWGSSNSSIAAINAATGVVTGVALGTATITAMATDGSNMSATKTVTVKSSEASITTMTVGTGNYTVTPIEGGTANLYNAPRSFYSTLTAVPVTIAVAAGATIKIGTTPFNSGDNANFTSPVAFIVTAEDGATTKTYTVGIPAYNATTNPYGIYSAAQLSDVRNALDKSYKLMNDIALPALSAQAATDLAISDYAIGGWKPLGEQGGTGEFAGTFDGNNHLITRLKINRSFSERIGLFGVINSSSVIKFLGVVSEGVNGRSAVGVLAGQCRGNSSILNSFAAGPVTGSYHYVGGLCGQLGGYNPTTRGTISNCYASGTPTASNYAGGLVGVVSYGVINNSYATGTPVGSFGFARHGLVGTSTNSESGSSIGNCFATGGYGLTLSITSRFRDTITQTPVTNSYYPAQSPGGDCGTAVNAGATQATFAGFDFSNTWIWTAGQWPKLKNVPGTQPTMNLPQ